jgi:hypothetical protein
MQSGTKDYQKKGNNKACSKLEGVYQETEELIAIVGRSISTAKRNNKI